MVCNYSHTFMSSEYLMTIFESFNLLNISGLRFSLGHTNFDIHRSLLLELNEN